ncbi:MAG TPA: hypothetical protein VIP77_21680 [Jiangellaceae bacterium]
MRALLNREQFRDLFRTYEHTAFRLETRDAYNEPYTLKAMSEYLAGESVDVSFLDEWVEDRLADAAQGKRMSRVRIVNEPLNDYARYSLHVSQVNNRAGEDVRYLSRARADELKLPAEDYWLFDSARAVVFTFGDDGKIGRLELLEDPADLVLRCQWRDAAWHYAIQRDEYAAIHGVT